MTTDDRDHARIKKRGVELATAGLLMALGLLAVMDLLGAVELEPRATAAAVAVTLLAQGLLWTIPHRGWDDRLALDGRFILLPVAVAALLLGLYTWLAPGAEHLLLLGWVVALVFMAGRARMTEVVALATLMIAAHLGALVLAEGRGPPALGTFVLIEAGVFMMVNVYAGFVFEHLWEDRREQKDLRERLAEEARTDHLTGLLNRRAFDRELRAELARSERYGSRGAVALVDLDSFKVYNDVHGHPAGDDLLRRIARVLESESRAADRVARYGGEEFALIMPAVDASAAVEAAERLRTVLRDRSFRGEDALPADRLTVSVGLAVYPRDGRSYEEVLGVADRRLYAAKGRGKNRLCAVG